MANIAKLNVMLVATSSGLSKGLKKARKQIQSFSARANSQLSKFSTMASARITQLGTGIGNTLRNALRAATVAVAALATGLVYLTAQTANAIDGQAKMARRLGITFDELKSIELAAGLAGVSTDQLNTAFEKMMDTIGAAQMGEGVAIDAFENIGVSMEALNAMKPEARFRAIAAAINSIQDPSTKIAAARDIFGRGGGAIIELFAGGNAALDEAAKKIELFGLSLSSIETGNIEYMLDRIGELGIMFEGIGTQLSAYISPYMAQLADDTIAWVESMGGIEGVVDGSLTRMEDKLGAIVGSLDILTAAWRTLTGVVEAFGDAIPNPAWLEAILSWNPIRDTLAAQFQKDKSDLDLQRMQERAAERTGGTPPASFSGKVRAFAGRAEDNAAARAVPSLEDEQRSVNAGAIQAAQEARMAEFARSYNAKFAPSDRDQQEAQRRLENARERGFVGEFFRGNFSARPEQERITGDAIDTAPQERVPMINGIPQMHPDRGPMINGEPITRSTERVPMINGIPQEREDRVPLIDGQPITQSPAVNAVSFSTPSANQGRNAHGGDNSVAMLEQLRIIAHNSGKGQIGYAG